MMNLKVKVTDCNLSKELIFLYFDKDASKNKIKQNKNKVKDCVCETPLEEVFFLPDNGTRKTC
jgi:hypothetical protein